MAPPVKPLDYQQLFAKYPGEDATLFLDEAQTAGADPSEAEYRLVRKAFKRKQAGKIDDETLKSALGVDFNAASRTLQDYTAKGWTKKGASTGETQDVYPEISPVKEMAKDFGRRSLETAAAVNPMLLPALSYTGRTEDIAGPLQVQNKFEQKVAGVAGSLPGGFGEPAEQLVRGGSIQQDSAVDTAIQKVMQGDYQGALNTPYLPIATLGSFLDLTPGPAFKAKHLPDFKLPLDLGMGQGLDIKHIPEPSTFDAPLVPGEGFGPALPEVPPEFGGPRQARGLISAPEVRPQVPTDRAINSQIQGDLFAPAKKPAQAARKPLKRFAQAPEPIVPKSMGRQLSPEMRQLPESRPVSLERPVQPDPFPRVVDTQGKVQDPGAPILERGPRGTGIIPSDTPNPVRSPFAAAPENQNLYNDAIKWFQENITSRGPQESQPWPDHPQGILPGMEEHPRQLLPPNQWFQQSGREKFPEVGPPREFQGNLPFDSAGTVQKKLEPPTGVPKPSREQAIYRNWYSKHADELAGKSPEEVQSLFQERFYVPGPEEAKLQDYIKKSGNFKDVSPGDILSATVDSWKAVNKAISKKLLGNDTLKKITRLDDQSIQKSMAYNDFQGMRAIRDGEILKAAKKKISDGASMEALLGKDGFVQSELRRTSNEMKATLVKSIQKIKPDATEKEILSVVSNYEELVGWERSLHEIVNTIKEGKVLGSGGGSYLNNLIGDSIFEALRGGGGFKHYKRAFSEVKAAVKDAPTSIEFKEAMKAGLFGSEAFAGDIKNAVKVAFNDLRPDKASNVAVQAFRAASKKGAQGRRFLSQVYDGTDKVAKFSAYLDEFNQRIAKGMSREKASREAVQAVYEFFPNYEKLAPGLQKLRKNVVGSLIVNPFIAFPAEASRIFKNAAMRNPMNFMGAAMGAYALYNYGTASAQLSGLVEKMAPGRGNLTQQEIDEARAELPAYSKFFGKYNFPLPWRDSNGDVQFLDATYMIPLMDVLNGGSGWKKENTTPENVADIFSNAIGGTFMRGLLVAPNEMGFTDKAEMGPTEALRQTGYSLLADRDVKGAATNFGEFLRADTNLGGVDVPGPGRMLPGVLQKAADIPKVGKYETEPRSAGTQAAGFFGLRTTSSGQEAEQRTARSTNAKIRGLQDKIRAINKPTNKQPETTKQRRTQEVREQIERLLAEE